MQRKFKKPRTVSCCSVNCLVLRGFEKFWLPGCAKTNLTNFFKWLNTCEFYECKSRILNPWCRISARQSYRRIAAAPGSVEYYSLPQLLSHTERNACTAEIMLRKVYLTDIDNGVVGAGIVRTFSAATSRLERQHSETLVLGND